MRTKRELFIRKTLQEKKPLAFAKIVKHPEKIKNKECVALVQLQYNYACNFKCKHCAIEKLKKKNGRKMTPKDVKNIADQLDEMGLASICISGGEPLVFPDLKEVIDAIGPERFNISMDTNGFFLDRKKIKWLIKIGVDRVHLSIDGLEDNHSMFRGNNDSWHKCIEALKMCKKYGMGTIVNIVATKSLVDNGELVKQLEFIKQFDTHASIIYAKPVGAFEDNKDEILNTEDLEYVQSLTEKYNCSTHLSKNCGHDFGCIAFKRQFSITAYGDVLACPWIPISFGNIYKEKISHIIKRGLSFPWFSYDYKWSCLCGNKDSDFYKNILPLIKDQPTDWREIWNS